MKVEWGHEAKQPGGADLMFDSGVLMGFIKARREDCYTVHCMWMTWPDDDRVVHGKLWPTQYPEEHDFPTLDEAKQALLDVATVIWIGGWRGER